MQAMHSLHTHTHTHTHARTHARTHAYKTAKLNSFLIRKPSVVGGSFLGRLYSFEPKYSHSQNSESLLKIYRPNENFQTIFLKIFVELYKVLAQGSFTTSKPV